MTAVCQQGTRRAAFRSPLFVAGIVLLAIIAQVWLAWLPMLTEAILVPFYCCDLVAPPSPGNWQQRLNDFFAAFPGRLLLTFLFFLASVLIFRLRL